MRKFLATAVLAAGLFHFHVASAAAPAAAPAGDVKANEDMFTLMDANKDGILTRDEFAAHGMAGDFAAYDKNGDGKVTREEYNATEAGQAK